MSVVGRLAIRTKLALLAGVPVAGALILASIIAVQARRQAETAAALGSIDDVAQLSVHLSGVVHALQAERARMALDEGRPQAVPSSAQGSPPSDDAATTIDNLRRFLAGRDLSRLPARLARDLRLALGQIERRPEFRDRVRRGHVSVDEILTFYGSIDDAFISATAALTDLSDDGELLRSISSLVAIDQLIERKSREHALLGFVFTVGEFPPGAFKTLVTLTTEQDVYAAAFRASASTSEVTSYDRIEKSASVLRAHEMRDKAMRATDDDFDVDSADWFASQGDAVSSLRSIESDLLRQITRGATYKMAAIRASIRLGFWLSALVVGASAALAWIIARGIGRAIFGLARTTAEVRETKNFTLRAQKTSNDELGTLTDAFNDMLSTIQERDASLESQVAERTEELRRTVAELWAEMDLARKIQTVLLPSDPGIRSYDICATMVPASTVGGDYYDVFHVEGRDWILIGDVSGHGVTAGLSMMIVQTAVRTVLQASPHSGAPLSPKEVLCRVNAAVRANLQKIGEDQYMTVMALEIEGSRVRHAGLHQDILVYRASTGTVERIESRGIWIGLLDDISGLLDDDTFELSEGDALVLYTDGVTEARVGPERLGTERLADALRTLGDQNSACDGIVAGILNIVQGAPFEDDVTVVAARYTPHGAVLPARDKAVARLARTDVLGTN